LRQLFNKILLLLFFEIVILIISYLLISNITIDLKFSSILILSLIFTIITSAILIVFLSGRKKKPENQAVYTLSAIGIKFLSELLLAFFWFFVGKKSGLPDVLLFFVLYLAFTLFSILIISKEFERLS